MCFSALRQARDKSQKKLWVNQTMVLTPGADKITKKPLNWF
jgi:hypothetical protein